MSRRLSLGIITATACLAGAGTEACAQTVRTDAQSGDRTIAYEVDGMSYEAIVPGNDRINPEVRLVSTVANGQSVRYTYRLFNLQGGRALPDRGLWMVDIPCGGVQEANIRSVASDWLAELVPAAEGSICRFSTLAEREMQPGDSSSLLTIESRFLPAFVMATAYGVAGPHTIPSDEENTPDSVRSLVVQLRAPGGSGSGREAVAIAPHYDPSSLPGPITVIQLARANLLAMCGQMGWITNRGICRSLEVKLQDAEAALLEDDNAGAQRMMDAFSNELSAQRGKHVPEAAYLMLATMREYLLRNM